MLASMWNEMDIVRIVAIRVWAQPSGSWGGAKVHNGCGEAEDEQQGLCLVGERPVRLFRGDHRHFASSNLI